MGGHTCFVVLFITSIFLVDVSGYPDGNVGAVCESMLPSHGAAAQASVAPYQVIASNTTFNPGDTIQVTLKGNSSETFRGFMLEARNTQSSSTIPLGKFTTTDSQAQLLSCDVNGATYADSAVSHISRSEKSEIIVNWTAPNSNDIVFRATFVQTMKFFWTEVSSPIIQRSSSASTVPPLSTSSQNQGSDLTSTASSNLDAISSDGCGMTKFCFSNPSQCNPATDPNCYFMSSTPLDNQGLRFEMRGKASGYISIGFSDDKMMGDDDIYICGTTSSGQVDVQRAYATGRTRPSSKPLGEVDNIAVANKNGIIQCSFATRNVISTTQRAANNMYYLFFAYGTSSGGRINKHQDSPFISAEKVNVAVPQLASGNNDTPILIKTHGALMLIAWMTTGSIGILIAQYFKRVGNTKIFGKDLWFQLHWPLMTLTVVLTIIGFVLAFVQAKGWSYGAGSHPVLGCIVMGLALIQPLVAVFRPPPDHKRRWIFKYFHSILAWVIRPFAVAALFLGILLINSAPNKWPVKVLGGFVGWDLLVHILFILICCFGNGANCSCSDTKKGVKKPLLLIFIVYLCGNLTFLVAILVGIGQT